MYTLTKQISETLSEEEMELRKVQNRIRRKEVMDNANQEISRIDEDYDLLCNATPDETNI
jgi:DnaJ-domain-containing protein 1